MKTSIETLNLLNTGAPVPDGVPDVPNSEKEQSQPTNPNIISFVKKGPDSPGFICVNDKEDGSGKYFICVIDTYVESPDNFFELIQLLYTASENDTIHIKIYTYGGWVETGLNIIQAIFNSRAHVITDAIGICASIGAVIWCCGKERRISKSASLMFHMPSGFAFGKSQDIAEENAIIVTWFKDLLRRITIGILDDNDIDEVVNKRKDLFVLGEVVNERIKLYKQKLIEQNLEGNTNETA